MSLVLDTESVKVLEDIISQSEDHLGKPFSRTILYRKDGRVTDLSEVQGEYEIV